MTIINIIVIIILFLLTGFLSGKNKDKLLFIKAFISAIFMIITSFISIVVSCIITYYFLAQLIHDGNSIFILGVVIILLAGIINYYFIKLIIRLRYYNEMLIMILEYYIQWTTIFFTLYQFFTSSSETVEKLKSLQLSTNTLDISFMNIIILPILLVSWVSIAMTKIFIKDHKEN